MNDNRRRERSRNNKSSFGGLIALLLVFAVNVISELDTDLIVVFIPLIVLAVMAFVFVKSFKTAFNKESASAKSAGGVFVSDRKKRRGFTMPTWNRDEVEIPLTAAVKSSVTASYNYEQSAEDNFQRDRERRIKQLDGFLKNGIIEKEEYNILKARYMNNNK